MDQTAPRQATPPDVHCIHEVRVEVPHEQCDALEQFYTGLLGLPPWPPTFQVPGGRGFGDPRAGLYLQYRHDPHVDPCRRRFTLVVLSLQELRKRLDERPWRYEWFRGLGYTDQWLLLSDPVGHVIEIRQSQTL